MTIKAKIEAIIYAAEEPVSVQQIAEALRESFSTETPAITEDNGNNHHSPQNSVEDSDADPRQKVRALLEELMADYAAAGRGMEIRQVANGYRMSTKPEHHDAVRNFARSLTPAIRLSLPALETLAVIAYKQPVTGPEISEIRGVDCSGVLATLMDRKLITTSGRKAVVGRPILYKTTKEFLLRFGLNDVGELPSVEEFEKLAGEAIAQQDLFSDAAVPDATGVPHLESETSIHDAAETSISVTEETLEAENIAPAPVET
jgi:segregation and condensation protein B